MEAKKCPKCQGEMIKGTLTSAGAGVRWFEGKVGFWTMRLVMGKPYIDSYRCNKCNFLENYARVE